MELIAVVLKSPTGQQRFEDAKTLLNYGFSTYGLVHAAPEEPLPPVPVTLGTRDAVQSMVDPAEGLLLAAQLPQADTVVTAVMGSVGLEPTLAAIRAKKRIALANKETLVCAGELVMREAAAAGAEIVPVDSEHSAIFQCLMGCRDRSEVRRLLLTCSGGPFFGRTYQQLESVTPADALKHPNWTMGAKITIDSATLMNKGLELIEAVWLFGLPPEKIQIVVQRQSIVHSAVQFSDNSIIAQLGVPDMRIPIQYALTYPRRFPSPVKQLNLADWQKLTFYAPYE